MINWQELCNHTFCSIKKNSKEEKNSFYINADQHIRNEISDYDICAYNENDEKITELYKKQLNGEYTWDFNRVYNFKPIIKDCIYLNIARVWSLNSYCKRKKTGAIIVKDNSIISDGYNGTPSGFNNVCEENDKTLDIVLHAEANAITKLAKSTNSAEGATLYCTLSPCINCAKLIHQSGIKKIVIYELYRDTAGLDFLLEAGVEIEFISEKYVFTYLDENL